MACFENIPYFSKHDVNTYQKSLALLWYGTFYSKATYAGALSLLILTAIGPTVQVIPVPFSPYCIVIWDPDFILEQIHTSAPTYCDKPLLLSPVLAGSVGMTFSLSIAVAMVDINLEKEYHSNRASKRLYGNKSVNAVRWLQFIGLWDYWKRQQSLRLELA